MNTGSFGNHKCLARVWLLAALLPCLAPAQAISVGVTGGVPVSPHSRDYGPGCFDRGPLICGPNDFFLKPYSVGGIVDVHLPLGFSAEAGFQYERFHQDLAHGLIAPHGGNVNFGELYGVSANGWLFPCLLKYTLGRRRLAPFADAGATLRHLGAFDGKGIQLDFNSQPQPISVHFESGRNLDVVPKEAPAPATLDW